MRTKIDALGLVDALAVLRPQFSYLLYFTLGSAKLKDSIYHEPGSPVPAYLLFVLVDRQDSWISFLTNKDDQYKLIQNFHDPRATNYKEVALGWYHQPPESEHCLAEIVGGHLQRIPAPLTSMNVYPSQIYRDGDDIQNLMVNGGTLSYEPNLTHSALHPRLRWRFQG